ncbi:AI-2E family transporter [Mesorhizobium sp. RMAD-H1]|uniref:AI-2E family transporter n=1 Tax=Mesorhizobium sp. RMAD-H1 TaxID=2587065 RepID=UPI001617AD24|nr:AI-2E family transporter [Mesorhizobium sp. RMAD-H1]MBB2974349.1 putative PurR-regulated permease PerM [Mesorhizobium sp. RMAD-H1]
MQEAERDEAAAFHGRSIEPPQVIVVDSSLKTLGIGTFLIILVVALYFGRDFLLPVVLAFLLALVLGPVVRSLARRGAPEWATAILLVVVLSAVIASALYSLSGPVSRWIEDAPRIGREVQDRIAMLRRPVDAVVDASKQVEQLAESEDQETQRVVLSEPGLISRAASGVPEVAAQIGVTLILLLFLLSSGDMFYEKLVKSLPTLSDKKRGLRIARTVEREVSRYLFTISLINVGLGAAIAAGMFAIDMPNPVLWGVLAALLNFIPYLGALLGIVLVGLVSLVSFDAIGAALLAPLIYLACTTLEGQLVTPLVIGRRLEMNPVVIFLAIAFWGWLWGIVGALIAVPLLVILKVFADHVEGLGGVAEFLAGRDVPQPQEDEESDPPQSS